MKLFSLFILLILCNLSFSQKNADLESRLKELTALLLDPSEAGLKEITSSKITYGHSSSLIEDQATFIGALTSGKADYIRINVSNQTIDITGKTAVVRQIMDLDIKSNGTPSTLNLKVLLVWTKEKGKWILVARQAVRIPQQ